MKNVVNVDAMPETVSATMIKTFSDKIEESKAINDLKENLVKAEAELETMYVEARKILEGQGEEGVWNQSPYMLGVYNGMEIIVAMLEDREEEYREPPEVYLEEEEKEGKK